MDKLWVGTYTSKTRGGIYLLGFDTTRGTLQPLHHYAETDNPSFLALSADRRFLFAVNEGEKEQARVSAFRIDGNALAFQHAVPSAGDHPCYISVHPQGRWLAVANYTGGNLVLLRHDDEGRLQPVHTQVTHSGSGPFTARQEKPHGHCALFDASGRRLFFADLGLDRVFVYPFDANAEKPLQQAQERHLAIEPGGGPRHIAIHPQNGCIYVVEEMAGAVSVYRERAGAFERVQRLRCSDDETSADKGSADIHLSPEGNHLYVSNRARANSLALFQVASDGRLILKEHILTRGEQPRNFFIHPGGHWVLVANQRTNNLVVFKRDKQSGSLQPVSELSLPNPVCIIQA